MALLLRREVVQKDITLIAELRLTQMQQEEQPGPEMKPTDLQQGQIQMTDQPIALHQLPEILAAHLVAAAVVVVAEAKEAEVEINLIWHIY